MEQSSVSRLHSSVQYPTRSVSDKKKDKTKVNMPIQLVDDTLVPFPAFFIKARTKTEQRRLVAEHALLWLEYQYRRGIRGCVVFDIDDTLIDEHERVTYGFEFMAKLYDKVSLWFPVHVVTARPKDQHDIVMKMLRKRGFCIPPDRLHMLPTSMYGLSTRYVEKFKWNVHVQLVSQHGFVVGRFGDKLWDVAEIRSLDAYLVHVRDRDCYIFWDPKLGGTLSAKLPGWEPKHDEL